LVSLVSSDLFGLLYVIISSADVLFREEIGVLPPLRRAPPISHPLTLFPIAG